MGQKLFREEISPCIRGIHLAIDGQNLRTADAAHSYRAGTPLAQEFHFVILDLGIAGSRGLQKRRELWHIPLAASQLAGSDVKVCTVVGFPLGATSTEAKVGETEAALRAGAQEIDMVLNIGALRGDADRAVEEEIALVAAASHRGGAIVKVILETCLLSDDQKIAACMLAKMAGADFVKTSTGFGTSGATVHDVELMRRAVGPDLGVKASGGIRTLDDLLKMLAAGATRIGASAGVKIVEAARAASPRTAESGT